MSSGRAAAKKAPSRATEGLTRGKGNIGRQREAKTANMKGDKHEQQ